MLRNEIFENQFQVWAHLQKRRSHTRVGVGKYHVGLVKLEKVPTLESVDSESGSQVRVIGKHFNINS